MDIETTAELQKLSGTAAVNSGAECFFTTADF
jgi:hypothetical protein